MKEITEKTLVPISLVIALIGGLIWLGETLGTMNTRLARIEGKLGINISWQK